MYIFAGINKEYQHVNVFLQRVHEHMYIKFKKMKESGDKDNAKELETFFQTLKNYTANKENIANIVMYDILISRLEEIEKARGGRHSISTFFRRTGTGQEAGEQFEKDLGDVIQAMTELALNRKLSQEQAENIVVGAVKGSPGTVVTAEVAEVLKEMERISKAKLKSGQPPPYSLVNVYGKIDVQGLNLELNINGKPTTDFEKMCLLLNDATFSAKSYRSITWNGEAQKMLDELRPDLHLGNSNPYRAISGVLSDAGYNNDTIASAFCASWNDWKNGNTQTGLYIYHMRYIYELTGIGIINEDGTPAGLVRYFIYNDPTGDGIYVASTAEIIYQVMTDDTNIDNPFGRDIVIKKAAMRNHRYH